MYTFDPEQITFFAKTDARGQEVPFGIKASDRTRHVYVIGKTGMGKSTLLENMAAQDIKNGNGLAFIDPHGQTAETLLAYIPEERKDDVLYFAPFDTDYPISFNIMEDVGPDKRHLVVSGLMSVFKKIWVDAWSARMEYILSNTLLALLEYPDSTLLGVNRMLSDKGYREKVVANITDPAVRSFWVDEFANYNERYMQEAGDSIKNKIGQFTSNPLIRNIVGQPHSSFDIRKIMDERKIMIINLSKGLVGEQNANLLGSMLTTRIYLAAMSRADLTADQMREMPNFYFYVDEFQSFANATFADILSEARKYKLNLTIAHQYIEQMEEEVRNAVFGNVGTIISFRVGPFDAETLETVFSPKFLAPDIVNLGFAQVYLTLMIDGIGSAPFSATTLPPIERPSVSYRDVVIANSRRQFAKERGSVELTINNWHAEHFPTAKQERDAEKRATRVAKKVASGEFDARPASGSANSHGNSAPNRKEQSAHDNSNGRRREPTEQSERPARNGSERTEQPDRREKGKRTRNGNDKKESRNQGRNNGSKDTGDRDRPTEAERHERHEKSLGELRSILKNITREAPADDGPAPKAAKKDEAPKESVPKAGLREALATALHVPDAAKAAPTTEPKPTVDSTVSPSPTVTPPQPQTVDDPLAVKKLERMMRVNGSDKPPIK